LTFPVGNNTAFYPTSFNIYPNPSSGSFFILMKDKTIAKSEVLIYNTVGIQVLKKTLSSNMLNVNLPNGIYFIKISDNDEIQKIVIAK